MKYVGQAHRVLLLLSVGLVNVLCHAQEHVGHAGQTAPSCAASGKYTPLCGLHGPEEMELLPDKHHAIVSELPADMKHSDEPGLMLVDLDSKQVEPLPIETKPEPGWGEVACTTPPRNFGTHGIHLSTRKDGRLLLLVVNHDGRESIEDSKS